LADCLKLQGFDETRFKLVGSDAAKWKMLGNTIPTNLTRLVGTAVDAFLADHFANAVAQKRLKLSENK
jgi:hypothetical protein